MKSARLSPRPEVTPAPAWRVKGPGHHVLTDGVHVIGHVVEAPDGTFGILFVAVTVLSR